MQNRKVTARHPSSVSENSSKEPFSLTVSPGGSLCLRRRGCAANRSTNRNLTTSPENKNLPSARSVLCRWEFLYHGSLLSTPGIRGGVQQKVSGNIVKPADGDQMMNGHLVGPTFIPGIHGLGRPQNLSHLSLGQIVVLPKPP